MYTEDGQHNFSMNKSRLDAVLDLILLTKMTKKTKNFYMSKTSELHLVT